MFTIFDVGSLQQLLLNPGWAVFFSFPDGHLTRKHIHYLQGLGVSNRLLPYYADEGPPGLEHTCMHGHPTTKGLKCSSKRPRFPSPPWLVWMHSLCMQHQVTWCAS
jgi:hypothetical protein